MFFWNRCFINDEVGLSRHNEVVEGHPILRDVQHVPTTTQSFSGLSAVISRPVILKANRRRVAERVSLNLHRRRTAAAAAAEFERCVEKVLAERGS